MRPFFGAPIPFPVNPQVYSPAPFSSQPLTPFSPVTPVYSPSYSSLQYAPPCQLDTNIPYRLGVSLAATLNGGGSAAQYALMSKLSSMLGFPNVAACLQTKSATTKF